MCDIPVLINYGFSGINYRATIDNITTSGSLYGKEVIDLNYDPVSRRLFFFDELEDFFSIEQDGSDLKSIELNRVERLTVDGSNNIIYYIHKSTDTIYMLNMTNSENTEVAELADVGGAKDIDMDSINK